MDWGMFLPQIERRKGDRQGIVGTSFLNNRGGRKTLKEERKKGGESWLGRGG